MEKCESTPEGEYYVKHMNAKQRSDKRNSRVLLPQSGTNSAADMDLYLKNVKEQLGLYTGRILWTGNAVGFMIRIWWLRFHQIRLENWG